MEARERLFLYSKRFISFIYGSKEINSFLKNRVNKIVKRGCISMLHNFDLIFIVKYEWFPVYS